LDKQTKKALGDKCNSLKLSQGEEQQAGSLEEVRKQLSQRLYRVEKLDTELTVCSMRRRPSGASCSPPEE
jgi:hypothetical protein